MIKQIPARITKDGIQYNAISKARFCESNDGKMADLVVREKERNLGQLGRYRAWLTNVADETGNDTEELHEYLLEKLAPRVVTKIHGPKRTVEITQKKRTSGGHSLSMTEPEMSVYIEKCSALTGYPQLTKAELEEMGYISN